MPDNNAAEGDGAGEVDVGRLISFPGVAIATTMPTESLADVYLKSRSNGTRRSTLERLNAAAKLMGYDGYAACPFETWREEELATLHHKLRAKVDSDAYVPHYARAILGDVCKMLYILWRRRVIPTFDDYKRLIDLPRIEGTQRRREPETATEEDVINTLVACRKAWGGTGIRDGFLVALASVAGLRSKEYADLTLADIDMGACKLRVRLGKGKRDRVIYFSPTVLPYLEEYLAVRTRAPGPL